MSDINSQFIHNQLVSIYGPEKGSKCYDRLISMLEQYTKETKRPFTTNQSLFDERDVILITYGDILRQPPQPPLQSLLNFHQDYLIDTINTIHILPFFPYSSDDGFSVIDYKAVDSALGNGKTSQSFLPKVSN